MSLRYLIDGYNLLHAIGLSKRLGKGGLELARHRLIGLVRRGLPHGESTVVFDGTQASGPRDEEGVHVLFAKGEADDLIRDVIAHDSAPRTLCVVSSDHAVQISAKRRHAKVMDAADFLQHLESRPRAPAAAMPEKPTTEPETQHWLEAFGDIESDPGVRSLQEIKPLRGDSSKTKRPRQ
jgi:predicted RNA-binding protein with PIN domain